MPMLKQRRRLRPRSPRFHLPLFLSMSGIPLHHQAACGKPHALPHLARHQFVLDNIFSPLDIFIFVYVSNLYN